MFSNVTSTRLNEVNTGATDNNVQRHVLFYKPVISTGGQRRESPVLFSPGPSARTLAASCDGSTFILKGLMGICCLNSECKTFVDRKEVRKEAVQLCTLSPDLQTGP